MSTTLPASTATSEVLDRTEAAPAPVTAPVSAAPRERLVSLDVFRGLTIAGMLLVNNPWT